MKVGVAPIELNLSEHQLQWFGYIQFCPIVTPVRRGILYQEEDVRRGREKPRLTWEKVEQRDKHERNITETLALNMKEWRRLFRMSEAE